MMRTAARSASAVLTDSEYSKQDIHRHYGVALEKIHIAYCAVDPALSRVSDEARLRSVLARHRVRKPYIMFAGQQMQVKGPHVVVEAFARLRSSYPSLTLVIAGKPGNATPLIESTSKRLGLEEVVRQLAWVSDDDLQCLYSAAELMVFPSRYEGFGIPVLEAMQCGTPVITSRLSSLPEVAGGAAYYLDDINTDALTSALAAVLSDESLRADLVRRGFENVARFTWQRSAEQVLEALATATNRP